MEAMVTGTEVTSHSSALTGAITGTAYAVPIKSGNPERAITVQLTFASAPGASVYNLMGSVDNVTYSAINTTPITEATPLLKFLVNIKFVRLDQVSKTNAVQSDGLLLMA